VHRCHSHSGSAAMFLALVSRAACHSSSESSHTGCYSTADLSTI
jgi:hypothetical protein